MKKEDKIIADNLYDEEIEQRIRDGKIIDTKICDGRINEKPMSKEYVANWLSKEDKEIILISKNNLKMLIAYLEILLYDSKVCAVSIPIKNKSIEIRKK